MALGWWYFSSEKYCGGLLGFWSLAGKGIIPFIADSDMLIYLVWHGMMEDHSYDRAVCLISWMVFSWQLFLVQLFWGGDEERREERSVHKKCLLDIMRVFSRLL